MDGLQPIRSTLEGDGDSREGERIYYLALGTLICCRCFWLFSQAMPALLPRRPHHICVCVTERDRRSERKEERFFISYHGTCREIIPSPQSNQIIVSLSHVKIRTKRTCIPITSPISHINQKTTRKKQSAGERCKLLYYRFKATSSCSRRVIYIHQRESALLFVSQLFKSHSNF